MGNSRLSSADWTSYSTTRSYATTNSAFDLTSKVIDDKMLPQNITVREARDSVLNPNSLPIILAMDCTGSMSSVILTGIKKFNVIIDELVEKKAVTDPAIMTMFLDDVIYVGQNALQVTQFESDLEAVKQLEGMKIVGNGGGNSSESYHLPLYMAAFKTKTDAYEKRNKRGYMFIVGDEGVPPPLTKSQIQQVFGRDESTGGKDSFSYEELYESASKMYDVFHVVVMQGNHAMGVGRDRMLKEWAGPTRENVIILDDIETLPEVIVSTIRLREGHDRDDVVKAWNGSTAISVANATSSVSKRSDGGIVADDGVVTL